MTSKTRHYPLVSFDCLNTIVLESEWYFGISDWNENMKLKMGKIWNEKGEYEMKNGENMKWKGGNMKWKGWNVKWKGGNMKWKGGHMKWKGGYITINFNLR